MNKRKLKIILLLSGIILIIASIIGFILIEYDKQENIKDNKNTLEFIEERILTNKSGFKNEYSNNEMPIMTYNSLDYVAILEIFRLKEKFPISNEWSKKNITKVPCRFYGSAYTGTLVIGGVDIEGQFDFVSNIDINDEIILTDMKGVTFKYNIINVKHLKYINEETLINEKFDLVLFAKESKTRHYIIIQCNIK